MSDTELPDAELDVLAALWHRREATAREIREALAAHRPMTHGATVTLLRRLEAKGFVVETDRKVGKAHVFRAAGRPARTIRRHVDRVVARLFGGDRVRLVSALFEGRRPSQEQIADLEKLLDDLKRRRGEDA